MAQAARRTTSKAKSAAKSGASRGKAASTAKKSTGAKKTTEVKKPAAGKNPGASKASSGKRPAEQSVSVEERNRMIAEAAYYKAQERGFSGGDPQMDWIEAEAEIDATLLATRAVRK